MRRDGEHRERGAGLDAILLRKSSCASLNIVVAGVLRGFTRGIECPHNSSGVRLRRERREP
jgi:hypothetical protein